MASQKQVEANRRNSEHSTGPQHPETKAKTRLNALRDGFTGQVTTLSDEDRPIFEKFKSGLIHSLAPKTTMELSLADSIAWDTWRLNHLRAVEMNMYALGTANADDASDDASDDAAAIDCDAPALHTAMSDAKTFSKEAKKFALMSLYEQRMNRSIHKNLATLRDLQAERRANHQRDLDEEIILARANDINGLPYEAPAEPLPDGSVFSNREIFAAAHRLTALQAAKTTLYQAESKVQFAAAASAAPSGTPSDAPSNLRNWPEPDAA
jgi:hypothetical protein